MAIRILKGDCRVVLRSLEANSVQTCITSPPYYALRSYANLPALVWGQTCCEHDHEWGPTATSSMRQRNGAEGGLHEGRATNKAADNVVLNPETGQSCQHVHARRVYSKAATVHGASSILSGRENGQTTRADADVGESCQHVHEWGDELPAWKPGQVPQTKWQNVSAVADGQRSGSGQYCRGCEAWRGHLGLEPTVEMYIEHLVECFREVKRVLRENGTLWLNLGTTYAGSGKGPTGWNGIGNQEKRQGFASGYVSANGELVKGGRRSKTDAQPGYKAKDLILIPFLVAEALRADGWYVRSMIPWLKRNGMPESVKDRPATAVEYIILLSKGANYYYDPDAVRMEATSKIHAPGNKGDDAHATERNKFKNGRTGHMLEPERVWHYESGRNRRNSDWFFESWQGMLLGEDDEPLAFVVNPAGFKEAHYATMPTKLVLPMLMSSTSDRGCCPECGAPWERVVERTGAETPRSREDREARDFIPGKGGNASGIASLNGATYERVSRPTNQWQPSCEHAHPTPVPCIVLDPFSGAATTALVADRHGRDAIGCELSETYSDDMSASRLIGDAPLFVQLGFA